MSINKVILVGQLGRDPEIKMFDDGNAICKLNVATENRYKDKKSGEWVKATEWHKVVQFGAQYANNHARFLAKGSKVYAEGRLQTNKWEDQEGVTRYSTQIVANQIVYLSPPPPQSPYQEQQEKPGFDHDAPPLVKEDDIPF